MTVKFVGGPLDGSDVDVPEQTVVSKVGIPYGDIVRVGSSRVLPLEDFEAGTLVHVYKWHGWRKTYKYLGLEKVGDG